MLVLESLKLKQRIKKKCGKLIVFAKQMQISERSLYAKLSGQSPWKNIEILKAVELLDIQPKEVNQYFFTKKTMPEVLPTSDGS